MELGYATIIGLPLLGAVIGYLTNRIAVKMIFRPIRPINVLGIKIQGLMGRRQADLANSIGEVVGEHLVQHEDIVKGFEKVDLADLLSSVLDKGLGQKIQSLKSLPLIGGFLTDERITELKQSLIDGILAEREMVMSKLEEAVTSGLDVRSLVREKVAAFPVEQLEAMVLRVAARELRAIEILGGFLGLLIGIGQVLLVAFTG